MDEVTAPTPFPSADEREALVLEFQRLTARLVRAGLLPRSSATTLIRGVNEARTQAEQMRRELPELVQAILLSFEDGTLRDGVHVVAAHGRLALHLESVATALYRMERSQLTARSMTRLFRFGWQHFREVVVARSQRATFGPNEDRRRAVVLDLRKAHEFVGSPVPSR